MPTFLEWYRAGGPFMPAVALVLAVALAIVAERVYVIIVRGRPNGRSFMERSIQLVRSGKIDDAIRHCAGSTALLPDLGLLILRSRTRDEADLQSIASAAILSLTPRLKRRLPYLPTLAVVALLIGVAGAAAGLDAALSAAATSGAGPALRPLVFGAVIAAILVAIHAFLRRQAEAIGEQVEEYAARLINALIERPDVRLGHR